MRAGSGEILGIRRDRYETGRHDDPTGFRYVIQWRCVRYSTFIQPLHGLQASVLVARHVRRLGIRRTGSAARWRFCVTDLGGTDSIPTPPVSQDMFGHGFRRNRFWVYAVFRPASKKVVPCDLTTNFSWRDCWQKTATGRLVWIRAVRKSRRAPCGLEDRFPRRSRL